MIDGLAPLIVDHWREVAPYSDIPLNPDLGIYIAVDENGMLRCFTVRSPEWELIGYAIFLVIDSPQYGVKCAKHEVLYLSPPSRFGLYGMKFIAWCDQQLREEGVVFVTHAVRPKNDFSPVLKRLGYQHTATEYTRRLDKMDKE